jgi:hypothetical protein
MSAPIWDCDLPGIELREQPYEYDRALVQAAPEYRKNLFVLASPFFFRDRQSTTAEPDQL